MKAWFTVGFLMHSQALTVMVGAFLLILMRCSFIFNFKIPILEVTFQNFIDPIFFTTAYCEMKHEPKYEKLMPIMYNEKEVYGSGDNKIWRLSYYAFLYRKYLIEETPIIRLIETVI